MIQMSPMIRADCASASMVGEFCRFRNQASTRNNLFIWFLYNENRVELRHLPLVYMGWDDFFFKVQFYFLLFQILVHILKINQKQHLSVSFFSLKCYRITGNTKLFVSIYFEVYININIRN